MRFDFSLVLSGELFDNGFVLGVKFDTSVGDLRGLAQVIALNSLIVSTDHGLLVAGQRKQFAFLFCGKSLKTFNSGVHLFSEDGHKSIILVGHLSLSDSGKSTLERGLEDSLSVSLVVDGRVHGIERAGDNSSKMVAHVDLLLLLDGGEHVLGSVVEVELKVELLIGEIVDERPLFNVVVFTSDVHVLQLLLGVDQVGSLLLLESVSPHGVELLTLVSTVHIVENRELGSQEVGEVSDFNVTEVEANKELVMEDHSSEPLVVVPASKSRDGRDCSNVGGNENETSSGSGERFVMGGDLLGSNSLEQRFPVVHLRVDKRVLLGVIRVDVSLSHVSNVLAIE